MAIPQIPAELANMPTIFTPTRRVETDIDQDDYDRFVAALPDRAARLGIGLYLGDADAALLGGNAEWRQVFYRQWIGQGVAPIAGAPVAIPRTAEAAVITLAPVAAKTGRAARTKRAPRGRAASSRDTAA